MKLPIRKQAHPLSLFLDKWLESDGLFGLGELENVGINMSLYDICSYVLYNIHCGQRTKKRRKLRFNIFLMNYFVC